MRFMLGVDVGGTFTAFVAYDAERKAIEVWKEPSVPNDPVTGILNGLADFAYRSKNELAAVVEFDWQAARQNIQSVRPGMRIFRLSAKTGEGMQEYLDFLAQQLTENRAVAQT